MKNRWISLIVLLSLVVAGCGQTGDLTPLEPQIPPSMDEPSDPPENPSPNSTQPVEVVPVFTPTPESPSEENPMPNPSDPEVQPLIDTAIEDLSNRFSVPSDQIEFKEVTELVWPDSSLGCPNPSVSYLQVLTPGYLIRLQVSEVTYQYHADKKGKVIYCQNPSPLPLDALPKE